MDFIPRGLTQLLEQHTPPKACVLFGPRRAGKTTLLRMFANGRDVSWYDGDDRAQIASYLNLLSSADVKTLLMSSECIIIDEAQRVPDIGLLIKRLVDANTRQDKKVPIFATGSSSLELSAGVRESALGRLVELYVWPLSTAEIAATTSWGSTLQSIDTRIVYGMYPEVYTNPGEARNILIDHCRSLLFKDLFDLSGIRFSPKFESLVQFLAYNIGSVISYDGLSRETGLSKNTVIDYLRLLEQCFIIKVCPSYAKNMSNEMRKGKKVFFCDNGIRNAIIRDFSPLSTRSDAGALWENFFYMERVKYHSLKRDFVDIYFWRTTGYSQKEIDFVEVLDNVKMRAFECKLSANAKAKGAEIFTKAYPDCPLDIVTPRDLMRLWQE